MTLRPLRLRTKITLYFVALVVCWTILIMVSLRYMLDRTVRRFFRERGNQIVQTITNECVPLVHYEELAGMTSIFERFQKSFEDIRYIAVLDSEGNPIQSTFRLGVPSDLLRVSHSTPLDGSTSVQLVRAGGELLYDYECRSASIRVRAGLSLAPIHALIQHTTTIVLWVGIAGLFGVFTIALRISRPVEVLSTAIERVVLLDHQTTQDVPPQQTFELATISDRFHELVDRLEERTKQLDASKKLAYLGEISSSIAHEVNNPLGVMVMNSDFLAKRAARGELSPDAAREVERLDAAARRATLAVQKLLEFARYSTRGDIRRFRPADIRLLVQQTLDLLQDRIQSAGCAVRLDIPKPLPQVRCDEQGVQQVFFNLLTNALDASPEGSPIGVRVEVDDGWLAIQVSDRGAGMSEEVRQRAKEPFFTTKPPGKGTGLGLAISDSIVAAHRGELLLKSAPGAGTTVTVRLPMERS